MLEQIFFPEFYNAIKHELPHELFKHLDPDETRENYPFRYFKCRGVYLGFYQELDDLFIFMAVGSGPEFMREIRKEAVRVGFKGVKFITSENNKTVQILAKYYKANLIAVEPQFYGPNEDGLIYRIDLSNSRVK